MTQKKIKEEIKKIRRYAARRTNLSRIQLQAILKAHFLMKDGWIASPTAVKVLTGLIQKSKETTIWPPISTQEIAK